MNAFLSDLIVFLYLLAGEYLYICTIAENLFYLGKKERKVLFALQIQAFFFLLEFLKLGRLVHFYCFFSLFPQGSTAITVPNISWLLKKPFYLRAKGAVE